MTEYRASFDATIRFSNGGDLIAHGFRADVPSPGTDEDGIAALFVASLGLLMTDSVALTNVEIFAEPPIIAAYDQGVHLLNVKVGFQRLKGQKRTEMIH